MVLIVDDKPENIISLKSFLELNDFPVDTALSGEEALKKIYKNAYALIILDVQMPGMDGFEVAETISGYSKAKDVPIIFLSAVNIDKKFVTRGYSSGGIDYVTKPFDPDILLLKVKTFYRLYEQNRELVETQQALRNEVAVRREAEEALYEKVQELHSYLESIPQMAFTADPSGQIEFVNEQWKNYCASAREFPATHPDGKSFTEIWHEAMVSASNVQAELRIRRKDTDDYRFFLLTARPIRSGDSIRKWVGTLNDIHEQKMANELLEQKVKERTHELSEINKELEASNHDLQQFASVASHDLKEPLRKIQVFSSIIRDRYVKDDSNGLKSYMNRIINSSERMSGLINDLLSFSRLSVSSLFHLTDLNLVIRDILSDLEISTTEKSAQIEVAQLPHIEVIPGQIRQVFQNIISNALKFSKEDQPPKIHISSSFLSELDPMAPSVPSGDFARIVVEDNGIGFDEKYLDRIFTLFQRLNPLEVYEGTGIGLAIAKKIIDKHGGIITATSRVNEGSTFIVVLPVKQMAMENTTEEHY